MAKKKFDIGATLKETGLGAVGAIATDIATDAINNNLAIANKYPSITKGVVLLLGLTMENRGNDFVKPIGNGMAIMSTVNLARPLTGKLKLGLGKAIYKMGYAPGRRGKEGS